MAISGEVHGDERIGPQVAIAFLELLITKYIERDTFFMRMVNTRMLTIIPMTNAVGYETNKRGKLCAADGFQTSLHVLVS